MKKIYAVIIILLLVACSPQASPESALTDREGNAITLPTKVEKIVTMGPSNTEIIASLGLADKIVAIDTYSDWIPGLNPDIPAFDMMQPDAETMITLEPDLVLVTGMSKVGGVDLYKPLADIGICVAFIPVSDSIEDIKLDIQFLGDITGTGEKASEIIAQLDEDLEAYRKTTGDSKKKVYFELSAAPAMYSFGTGVFLNEMIEILGAENIFADQQSWISVSDEEIISRNPDVIFTNVSYIDDPVGEIKSRGGWENITAVKTGQVYQISTNPSSLPNQFIVIALEEMAKALYD